MSPKIVTVGQNIATILELPGEGFDSRRFLAWDDTDSDGTPVKVHLEIRRTGNHFSIRLEEWNGQQPEPLRIASGDLETQNVENNL